MGEDRTVQEALTSPWYDWCESTLKACDVPIIYLCLVTVIGSQAGIWMGKVHWTLELLSHFQCQYLFVVLIGMFWFLLRRQWPKACGCAIFSMVIATALLPYWVPGGQTISTEPTLRVASVNVNRSNQNYETMVSFLDQLDADVVVVQEVTAEWAVTLRELDLYPHSLIEARSDGFGIALLSKTPLLSEEVIDVDGVPFLKANVKSGGELEITVIGVHPVPPMGSRYSSRRNRQLAQLEELCKATDGPLVVAGDFNCSPFSPYFKSFLKQTKLIDTRLGRGVKPSWPQRWFLKIPIDHVLVSEDFVIHDLKIGTAIGSDHDPVACDLSI